MKLPFTQTSEQKFFVVFRCQGFCESVWTKSVFTVISELSDSFWMLAAKTGFVFQRMEDQSSTTTRLLS